ncbi:hypothetical protein L6164_031308 [Bauhinia variegata]|uniref:Uncharacterized protein n=1 Tax=Bauhinia variegata TaxID=167791 RepID=A0ACB9LF29_BAUVA|nr:hypothetical protein L6164_031308 [Bauhinia variegata]
MGRETHVHSHSQPQPKSLPIGGSLVSTVHFPRTHPSRSSSSSSVSYLLSVHLPKVSEDLISDLGAPPSQASWIHFFLGPIYLFVEC